MLQAELMGKLPTELANSEDLLTSSIIGSIRYLSTPVIIKSIFERSSNIDNVRLQFDTEIQEVIYYFWPRLESCEPDVIVLIKNIYDQIYLICIEAKYFSGKSSEEDETIDLAARMNHQRDQIAREIEDIHRESTFTKLNIERNKIVGIKFIYLTNDSYIPSEVLEKGYSFTQERNFRKEELYWISWKEIYNVLNTEWDLEPHEQLILDDIINLCKRKNLASFGGFTDLLPVGKSEWGYSSQKNRNYWNAINFVEKNNWLYVEDLK